jgi:hypothetical protein
MKSRAAIWIPMAVLLLAACRTVPTTKEDALRLLIADIAAGRVEADPHKAVTPTDPVQSELFLYVEEWLNVNAEALTHVSPALSPEGPFTFTRSANGRITYLISDGWPGKQVRTKALRPVPGTRITMLGWPDPLPWEQLGAVCVIATPREMADEANHPCTQAFVFRFEAPAR